ncbi:MAG: hypothetical protein ACQUHE_06305 [Bacteroidia bacterium]
MKINFFNPFTHIAGLKSLVMGFALMSITLVISFYSDTHFDGAIDAHIGLEAPFLMYAVEQVVAWSCVAVTLCIGGLILSKSKFRFIDVAGVVALSRAPMVLVAIMGFIPMFHTNEPLQISNSFLALSIVMLFPVVWMIALLFNGFKVAVNIKGTKAIVGFIIALLLAEILSIYLNHLTQSIFLHV